MLDIYPEELDALVFGLALLPVLGNDDKSASIERRPSHPQLHSRALTP